LAARGAQVLGAVDGLFVTIATSDELPLARLRGKALGRLGLARLRVDADNVAVLSERQVAPTGPSVAPRPRPGS
ncbi:MAG: hypothetical protein L0H93_23110, partial [Nocardioides sp.]|nr:hypothetical protein [Nocardioides sp.]